MRAYPSIDNAPSNAICRKLGFALLGSCDFEYPQGSFMQCNDWRLDLVASRRDPREREIREEGRATWLNE
jgi:RimJ/RimL family protein N-acetyltransferase